MKKWYYCNKINSTCYTFSHYATLIRGYDNVINIKGNSKIFTFTETTHLVDYTSIIYINVSKSKLIKNSGLALY